MNNISFKFNDGNGYIEKDWENPMPSSWIWIQTNNFKNSNSSIMISIARIPWLGFLLLGLGFYYVNNEVVRFGIFQSQNKKLDKHEKK